MANQRGKTIAGAEQEIEQTVRVFKRRRWIFFHIEVEEIERASIIGTDVYVKLPDDGMPRRVHVNGREYVPEKDPGLAQGGKRSKCCNARMVAGGIQCEACGSDGK